MIRPAAVTALFILWVSAAPAAAREGCFANWFCITSDKDGQVQAYRQRPHPVVVTLYSRQLTRPVTVSLTDDTFYPLGEVSDPAAFWPQMQVKWTAGRLDAQHDDTARYAYPLQPPNRYPVVQGNNGAFSHQGRSRYAIDFAAPVGTPVLAARAGTVIDLQQFYDKGGPSADFARYANYVVVLHRDGTTGEYYHLKYRGAAVHIGQQVNTGALLGYSGNTGFSSLPHLHFAVYKALPDGQYQSLPFRFESSSSK